MDELLSAYGTGDYYPFHMPGHKRVSIADFAPYQMDITEIDGFDNLHHATGVIDELQRGWAKLYGCDRAFILVNGTTCGNEAAIFAATHDEDTVIVARGCHRSVYHALALRHANCEYLMPKVQVEGICLPVTADHVEEAIRRCPKATAVIITSPTYEGLCADVEAIATLAHGAGMSLIVDAAHGAHLGLGGDFPQNPIHQGADAVVVSLHKTLPTFTQTACLLWKETSRIDASKIQKYLGYFESSSPSYLLMASTAAALRFLEKEGQSRMESYGKCLAEFRERLEDLTHLTVAIPDGWTAGVNADPSKILIRGRNAQISGEAVMEHLRQQAHLELEMATPTYALAMTSLMDTEEGFTRLEAALRRMDTEEITTKQPLSLADVQRLYEQPRQVSVPLGIAKDKTTTRVALSGAAGAIAGGFVNLYPPGIPVFAPGEVLEEAGLAAVARAMEAGFAVDGIEEQTIEILDE